jgi:capsular exopolysaccharide synthesis family protein
MDVYIKDQYAAKHKAVDNATGLLRKQASDLRQQVRRLEEAMAAYRAEHNLSQGVHAGTTTEEITHLTEDLAKARTERAAADARLDAARGNAGAQAQASIAPSVVSMRAQLDQLAAAVQARSTRLGSAHPEAQALGREYQEARRALSAEIARVVASIEAEQHAATEREAALAEMLKTAETSAEHENRAYIPLNAMQRDLDAARAQLQGVLERIEQTAQQAAVESSEGHEISYALPPDQPSSPRYVQATAASIAAAGFLGLILVYVLHLLDGTVRSGDDVKQLIGLPCLALIPEVGVRARRDLALHDYVARRPLTAYAEQIRALRAALTLDVSQPQVVAITAAGPAEGKSVLALSLGRSAQLGEDRVLAIECDVRQPSFQARLGVPATPGLTEILRGDAEWRDVMQADPVTGMDVIPAGKPGGDVLSLFQSQPMRQLLEEARDHYSLILLDAPPVEAIAEARVVAALADATLLCIRWRHTAARTVAHALEVLRDARATVIGAVLTRVDQRAHCRSGSADSAVYRRRYKAYYRG